MSAKRRRHQTPRRRDRVEIYKAVGVSAGIVVVTALLVWLLRPGPSSRFDGGGGGIFNRQPRASWLVGLTLIALAVFVWWVLTQRHRRSTKVLLGGGGAAIVVVAIGAGVVWPGGLLRDYEPDPAFDLSEFEDLTSTTVATETPTTAGEGTETSVPEATPPVDETTPATGSP